MIAVIQLVVGFILLALGGRFIVRGAVSIALLAKVSTAVVGLTVVAFGTSLPEMAVSVNAAAVGATDLAYANVVGSSIFNLAVILGVAALIRPVLITQEARRLEHPAMFMVLALCLFMARDRLISRPEGVVLLVAMVLFVGLTVAWTRAAGPADHSARTSEIEGIHPVTGDRRRAWGLGVAYVIGGIIGLGFGSDLLVDGATTIAQFLGVSERIIGLTVVAMGTSLPELAASAAAAVHGEDEIALSNLLGSNIFNILSVLGVTAAGFPVPVNARAAALDNWVMLGFGAVLFPVLWSSRRVTRWHGALLLTAFTVYFGVLVVIG